MITDGVRHMLDLCGDKAETRKLAYKYAKAWRLSIQQIDGLNVSGWIYLARN